MRRLLVLIMAALMIGGLAAPGSAGQGDVIRDKQVFSIPEDLDLVEDLGQLNHGCGRGLFTLVDGTLKMRTTISYLPSLAAFESGQLGATMTFSGINKYSGVWDVDTEPGAQFRLKDNNLRYEFVYGSDGSEISQTIKWRGSFVDMTTGETAEWWVFDFTASDGEFTGRVDGTC